MRSTRLLLRVPVIEDDERADGLAIAIESVSAVQPNNYLPPLSDEPSLVFGGVERVPYVSCCKQLAYGLLKLVLRYECSGCSMLLDSSDTNTRHTIDHADEDRKPWHGFLWHAFDVDFES